MCSPVMLTVAGETLLNLDIDVGESSFESVISGRVSSYGDAVVGKKVKIYVNDTLRAEPTTQEGYGDFSVTLNLPSVNNNPTVYNVQAVFEGDDPQNATAYAYTPNGTRYSVCTTVQYGFKPATNMTTLTVDLQSTQVMHATKTAEEMQQEAEQSGQLRLEPRFSLWYPWFTLHYILSIEDEDVLDIGLAALGCDIVAPEPIFDLWTNDFMNAILKAYVIGWITTEIAVLAATWYGPQTFVVALIGSVIVKTLLLAPAWNSVQDLKSSFIGAWAALIIGMAGVIHMLHTGIISLAFGLIEAVAQYDFWKFIYRFIYVPINIVFLLLILNRLSELGGI